MFYLETACHLEVRRPWKIEFGCTVVYSQIIASCLLFFARLRARVHAYLFPRFLVLRRASLSHSLSSIHSLTLLLSHTLTRPHSPTLAFKIFFFVSYSSKYHLISHKYHSRALSSLILRYILSICLKYISLKNITCRLKEDSFLELLPPRYNTYSPRRFLFFFSFSLFAGAASPFPLNIFLRVQIIVSLFLSFFLFLTRFVSSRLSYLAKLK